jgi:hypothetical protein
MVRLYFGRIVTYKVIALGIRWALYIRLGWSQFSILIPCATFSDLTELYGLKCLAELEPYEFQQYLHMLSHMRLPL